MDLLEQLEDMDEPPLVAPWEYTEDVFPLAELDRSLEAWHKSGADRPAGGYRGWHRGYAYQAGPDGHHYVEAIAHRPNPEVHMGSELVSRAHCECGWTSGIGSDREAVAAWHDHAWPGWRDLPVIADVPMDRGFNPKAMAKYRAMADEVQPAAFRVDLAPVISHREPPRSRNVPNYSPYGGFDIGHLTLEVPA